GGEMVVSSKRTFTVTVQRAPPVSTPTTEYARWQSTSQMCFSCPRASTRSLLVPPAIRRSATYKSTPPNASAAISLATSPRLSISANTPSRPAPATPSTRPTSSRKVSGVRPSVITAGMRDRRRCGDAPPARARGGVAAVERAPGGGARQVGPDDEGVGVDEVQPGEHGEPLDQRSERKATALPAQRGPGKPGAHACEVQHDGGRVEPDHVARGAPS